MLLAPNIHSNAYADYDRQVSMLLPLTYYSPLPAYSIKLSCLTLRLISQLSWPIIAFIQCLRIPEVIGKGKVYEAHLWRLS